MRFKKRTTFYREDFQSEVLPLTPLLDIIFLVTIFFVLTSGAVFQQMLEIDLPESTTSTETLEKTWLFVVHSPQKIIFNQEELTLETLDNKVSNSLSSLDPATIQVSLAGAKKLEYQVLIQVFDILRRHGIMRISLLTEDVNP